MEKAKKEGELRADEVAQYLACYVRYATVRCGAFEAGSHFFLLSFSVGRYITARESSSRAREGKGAGVKAS